MENQQRAITPKVWCLELCFLCTALLLNEIYLPLKFKVSSLNTLLVILGTKFGAKKLNSWTVYVPDYIWWFFYHCALNYLYNILKRTTSSHLLWFSYELDEINLQLDKHVAVLWCLVQRLLDEVLKVNTSRVLVRRVHTRVCINTVYTLFSEIGEQSSFTVRKAFLKKFRRPSIRWLAYVSMTTVWWSFCIDTIPVLTSWERGGGASLGTLGSSLLEATQERGARHWSRCLKQHLLTSTGSSGEKHRHCPQEEELCLWLVPSLVWKLSAMPPYIKVSSMTERALHRIFFT